jgi:A/G-specific adenine glycosylase
MVQNDHERTQTTIVSVDTVLLVDVGALLDWYERVRRPLPWRFTRDPYALLVSEVMLQQTQAPRVVPFYERWLARWPTAEALAEAPVRDVLALWSGLGYNRRALALRDAARVVASSGWPCDLTSLPSVGPYTAAAVASFAWDVQIAAVDTNVRRVLSRRDGVERSPRELAARAASLLPEGRAAMFNQAMMELGATVCRPRAPACEACPVAAGCHGPLPVAPRRGRAVRFEDTDRWARGRVLAALLAGEEPVVSGERLERAVAGLERDGLIVRAPDGSALLP